MRCSLSENANHNHSRISTLNLVNFGPQTAKNGIGKTFSDTHILGVKMLQVSENKEGLLVHARRWMGLLAHIVRLCKANCTKIFHVIWPCIFTLGGKFPSKILRRIKISLHFFTVQQLQCLRHICL